MPIRPFHGRGKHPLCEKGLSCRDDNELNRRISLEAACVFSALLAADKEGGICQDMLEAAPLLIAHLSGGMGTATAEQCAWILGEHCVRKDKQSCLHKPSHTVQLLHIPTLCGRALEGQRGREVYSRMAVVY